MSDSDTRDTLPTSTKWTMDAVGETEKVIIPNVLMIYAKDTNNKGSGFLLDNGYVVTNFHVIAEADISNIIGTFSSEKTIKFTDAYFEEGIDLVILKPAERMQDGLSLDKEGSVSIGELVHTWGYPLGYNGPAPLFSAGFLSGFIERESPAFKKVKHLVINGAFNNGNSGGALFRSGSDKVLGVVATKHMPLSGFHKTAIEALVNNESGVIFTASDENGKSKSFSESQLVGDILKAYQPLVQVMIGEAICISELIELFKIKKIS